MAIALVTTASASTGTTVPFGTSVTTSGANNFIIAWVVLNGPSGTIRPTAPTISDSNNLVWFLRKNSVPDDFAVPDMYMYYAWAPTGITTSISVSALNPVSMSLTVAVFSGVNTTAPFDPNLAMPSQTNGTDLIFNTTLPNTTLVAAFSVSSPTPIASYGVPAGWTAVSTDGNYAFAAFRSVTSAQSMSTTGFAGASANNSGIGDALQPASVAGYNYGNLTSNLSAIGIAASGAPTAGNPSAFQWSNYGYPGATAASGTFVGQDNAAGPNGYVAAGDLLVAVITLCTQSTSPPAAPTMPAPWVLRAINSATPTNSTVMAVFTKTGSAGEDVNYTCLWSGGTAAFGTWSLYNYGSCVFDYAAVASAANVFTAPQPTAFTSSINDLQLAVFYNGGAYGLVDAPGGFELQRVNTTYGGSLGYLAAYEGPPIANANATVTGPTAYTNPDVSVDQVAALITLETQPPGSSAVIHGSILEQLTPMTGSSSGTVTGTGYPSSFAWAKRGDASGKGATSMTLTGPANASVSVGDCLIALVLGVYGTASTMPVTMPSGWTLASSQDRSTATVNDNAHFQIWYYKVTASTNNVSIPITINYDGYGVWELFNYTNSTFESAVAAFNVTTSQNFISAPVPSPQPAYNGDVVLNLWWAWQVSAPALTSGNSPPSPAQRIPFGTVDGSAQTAATEFMVINKNAGIAAPTINAASSGLTNPWGGTVVVSPASAISGITTDTGNLSAALGAATAVGAGNVFGAGGAHLAQTTAPATLSAAGTVSGTGSHPGGFVWAVYSGPNSFSDDSGASPTATSMYVGSSGAAVAVSDAVTPLLNGDLIVIAIETLVFSSGDSGTITMPGWTAGPQSVNGGTRLAIFYATAGSGGWAAFTSGFITEWTNPAYYTWVMFNYGAATVDTSAILLQTSAQNGNGATITAPAITTTKANDLLLSLFFKSMQNNTTLITLPTGFTSRVNTVTSGTFPIAAGEKQLTTAGSVPAYSATSQSDGNWSSGASVAISLNLTTDTGNTSATLGATALSASGFIASNLSIGTLAQTTAAATLSASGSAIIPTATGTLAQTLASSALSAAGSVFVQSSIAVDTFGTTASSAATCTNTITTSLANEIIVLWVEYNGSSFTAPTITDTAGLTWTLRKNQASSTTPFGIAEYWALKPTAGATTITSTLAGAFYHVMSATAFVGVNPTTPFDTNASLPAGNISGDSGGALKFSTTNAAATLIAGFRTADGAAPISSGLVPSGYTPCSVDGDWILTVYKNVTLPQTNATLTYPGSGNGAIIDALLPSGQNPTSIGTLSRTTAAATLSSAGSVTGVTTHVATWIFSPKADTIFANGAGVQVTVTGTVSRALSAATLAATGAATTNTGALAKTLAAATLSSSGTVSSLLGTLAQTLGAATVSSAGSVTVNSGTLSQTTGFAGLVSSGLVLSVISGTVDEGLGAATMAAAGNLTTPILFGNLGQTLGVVTEDLDGTVYPVLIGTLLETTGATTLAAAGEGAFPTLTGTLSQTLEAAFEPTPATGLVQINGSVSKTLGTVALASAGVVSTIITGNLSSTTTANDALFPNSASSTLGPANKTFFDFGGGIECGIKFFPTIDTEAISIQFYKAPSDTVTSRTVNLWSTSGTILGSGTSTAEPTGTAQWIVVNLTTPVPLTAGTTYIASYKAGGPGITTWFEENGSGVTNAGSNGNLSYPASAGIYAAYVQGNLTPPVPVTTTVEWLGLSINTQTTSQGIAEIGNATLRAVGILGAYSQPFTASGRAGTVGRSIPRYTSALKARAKSITTSQTALMQHVAIVARGASISAGFGTLAPVTSTHIFLHTRAAAKTSVRSIFLTTPPPAVVDTENTFAPFTATAKLFATQITSDASGETLVIERAPTKAPNEARSVAFDFTSELATGETIASASVNIYYNTPTEAAPAAPANQPGDLTNGAVGINGNQVTTALALGVYGKDYLVTFTAVTSAGEIIPRSILLTVGQT